MVLGGGIVGTGFCNLVKEEKCKDDCYSIIHLLQEHKEQVDIKFFVRDGFDGIINVSLNNSGYTASLATFTKHESTDLNHNNYETKEEYNSMPAPQDLAQSSMFSRFNDCVDGIKHQTMKPQNLSTQQESPMAQDNSRSTPSVCHSQNESVPPESALNIMPQPFQPPLISSAKNCIPHNQHISNNNNINYGGHHASLHCIDGRHNPYNQHQNKFQQRNHNNNHNIRHISLPQIKELPIETNNHNNGQYLNQNNSNYNNTQYNNNNNNNTNHNNNNNCFPDDHVPSQTGYPYQQPFTQQPFTQQPFNELPQMEQTQAITEDYVHENNNNYFNNHNHNNTNDINNCFADNNTSITESNCFISTSSNSNLSCNQYSHSNHSNDPFHTNNLRETVQQQQPQYPQPMQHESDINAIKNVDAEHALSMDIGHGIAVNNNDTMFETDSIIEPLFMNNDLESTNGYYNNQPLYMLSPMEL